MGWCGHSAVGKDGSWDGADKESKIWASKEMPEDYIPRHQGHFDGTSHTLLRVDIDMALREGIIPGVWNLQTRNIIQRT